MLQQLAFEYIIWPIVATLITTLVGWIAAQWQKFTGQQIDAKHQASYQLAVENGIKAALQKLIQSGDLSPTAKVLPNKLLDTVLDDTADYVQRKTPDAVEYFGATVTAIKETALSKLPLPWNLNK